MSVPGRSTTVAIRCHLAGVTATRQAFIQLDKRTRKRINDQIAQSSQAIHSDARVDAPRDTGFLALSIKRERMRNYYGYRGERIIAEAPYAAWVEFGSWHEQRNIARIKGSKVPAFGSGMPLAQWAGRQSIPAAALALAMARSGGVAARPFMRPAITTERDHFYHAMEQIIFRDVPNEVSRRAMRTSATS